MTQQRQITQWKEVDNAMAGENVDVEALRADDGNWKAGFLYACRQDPAPLIPKRYGWGWTVNFGSPWIWLTGVVAVGVVVWGVFF